MQKNIAQIRVHKRRPINCAQNKALQKCPADFFVYLLVERDKALSAAL